MKNNKFIKFSLTVACAAVLAACGSSGGGSEEPTTPPKPPVGDMGGNGAGNGAGNGSVGSTDTQTTGSTSDVGAKFVKKTQSNLNVGEGVETNSKSSVKPTNMTVELHPSLDTIVVAIPVDSEGNPVPNAKQAYLEDFDFRQDATKTAASNSNGMHTLEHIYVTADGKTNGVGVENGRSESATKTKSMGRESGLAYVYEEGRLNYTRKAAGSDVIDPRAARTDAELGKSVAEVYGHRTFVTGDSNDRNNADGETTFANAPFTAKDAAGKYTEGSKLSHVQYGRVTSKLHGVYEADLKDGKDVAQYGTKVASYGLYGAPGTEDNYFFRGVNNTKAEELSALPGYYVTGPEGKLHYQGHAVTYGLPDDYKLAGNLPNALGAEYALVSGTHVAADVDLASKNVDGKLYNVWTKTNTALKVEELKHDLVKFDGTLANDGSISGKATALVRNNAEGEFKASLYGNKAQELGGLVASKDTTNNWGAAFGAKVQNDVFVPTVVTPPPAWGESTDQNNKK